MGTQTPPTLETRDKALVLFDGQCPLCNRSVSFIIKRDRAPGRFRFAPLQSEAGRESLGRIGLEAEGQETLVLIERSVHYLKSDAALRIARHLSGAWPLLALLRILPRFLRDWVYDTIAQNRAKWFGENESCTPPPQDFQDRFL